MTKMVCSIYQGFGSARPSAADTSMSGPGIVCGVQGSAADKQAVLYVLNRLPIGEEQQYGLTCADMLAFYYSQMLGEWCLMPISARYQL